MSTTIVAANAFDDDMEGVDSKVPLCGARAFCGMSTAKLMQTLKRRHTLTHINVNMLILMFILVLVILT